MSDNSNLSDVTRPGVFDPVKSETARARSFLRTRRAVRAGWPLYSYSQQELRDAGLMGPWVFNLAKSAFGAGSGILVLWFLKQLFPAPPISVASPKADFWNRVVAELPIVIPEVESWLTSFLILLATIIVAKIVGWGSIRSQHSSPQSRARATAAYLYYEGAYALVASIFSAVGLNIVAALLRSQIAGTALWFSGVSLFVLGAVLGYRFLYSRLPKLIFPVNGYHSYTKSLLARPRTDSEASWPRYELSLHFGSMFALVAAWLCVMFTSVAVAIPLSVSRALVGNREVERRALVAEDLKQYIKRYEALAPLENDLLSHYTSVTGVNYRDDTTLRKTLVTEVLPRSDQLLRELNAVTPRTEPLQRVHRVALNGMQTRHEAFTKLLRAIDTQNENLVTEANRLLQKSQAQQTVMLHMIRDVTEGRDY